MLKITSTYCDLDKIADSGQCFRWKQIGEHAYEIPAFGRVLKVRQDYEDNCLYFDCTQEEYNAIWKDYFDFDTDYEQYEREALGQSSTNKYLRDAIAVSRGIRILKQDLWETIVSFIISQNNNIPRIKGCIERLCDRFGCFPEPYRITAGGLSGLDGLGLGYRQEYIFEAAVSYFMLVGWNSERLRQLYNNKSYTDAREHLMAHKGIGAKVADCICLFGLAKKEAFPRDVWIKRIEVEQFNGRFPEENYPGYAGVLQQYIFFYERNRKG